MALLLGVLGVALVAAAAQMGGWGWVLVWPGASFLIVAVAYTLRAPGVFGKRPDGTLRLPNTLLLQPFLLYTWSVWWLRTCLTSEPLCHQITDGLWLGRRPAANDIPEGVTLVVDLTAEFPVARGLTDRCNYICLPTLDLTAPPSPGFQGLLEQLRDRSEGVYLHCALGHGRSACVAAAFLLARGLAGSVTEAESMLRRIRPGVGLTPDQRTVCQAWWEEFSGRHS